MRVANIGEKHGATLLGPIGFTSAVRVAYDVDNAVTVGVRANVDLDGISSGDGEGMEDAMTRDSKRW